MRSDEEREIDRTRLQMHQEALYSVVVKGTDWELFRKQKARLAELALEDEELMGILNWIDSIQDNIPYEEMYPDE